MDNGNYSIEIINDVSREVIDEVKMVFCLIMRATAYLTIGEDLHNNHKHKWDSC